MSTATDQPAPRTAPRLLRSSAIVSMMTMLSRVLGLARDVVFAIFIGASGGADAFFVAFKIPNFLRRLFAEGAFAQAFVPVLSDMRQNRSKQDVRDFIGKVAGCLGVSVISVSAFAVVAAPVVGMVFAPGFYLNHPEKYALTVDMIRLTFPYLALITMAGLVGSVLNSYDRFAIPALTPVLLNIVLISAAVFFSAGMDRPVMALAWGVLVAGVAQFSFQLPFLSHLGLLPKPQWGWSDPAVKKVVTLMVPALFGVSVSQINLLLDTVLASLISDGSVSWLYYSDRLIELPLGVFAIAIATVILPTLSRQHSAGEQQAEDYSVTMDWALRTVLIIAVPAATALIVLAQPVIATLFQYGSRFTAYDAHMASYSLIAYSLGLSAFMLIKVLVTGFFSRQDTKTPVKIGIIAMVANMVLNVALVVPCHMFWSIGHVGLALATGLSAFLNAGLLFFKLKQSGVYQPQAGWGRFFVVLLVASGGMAVALVILTSYLPEFPSLAWWHRTLNLGLCCAVGLATYLLVMTLGGWRPRHLRPSF